MGPCCSLWLMKLYFISGDFLEIITRELVWYAGYIDASVVYLEFKVIMAIWKSKMENLVGYPVFCKQEVNVPAV